MGAFEELLESWRSNPTADSTLALCSFLHQHPQPELVREVGSRAEQWHAADAEVMLAVGRAYLEAGLFAEAQSSLVLAGKADARDARPFRYLGEVLLRRGDAARAEKVLERAVQLGAPDGDTRLWQDRALVYVALQKRVGTQAVAAEVARTLPQAAAAAGPPVPKVPEPQVPRWTGEEHPTIPKAPPPPRLVPGMPPQSTAPPAPNRPRSVPPPLPPSSVPAPPSAAPPRARPAPPRPPSFNMGGAQAAALAEDDDDDETAVRRPNDVEEIRRAIAAQQRRELIPTEEAMEVLPSSGVAHTAAPSGQLPVAPAAAARAPMPLPPNVPASLPLPPAPTRPLAPLAPSDDANPSPDLVLEHLALVGVYEPGGGAPPAWERAPVQRGRGSWVLILATVLVLGSGIGAYFYAAKVKSDRMATAQRLGDEVAAMLHSGEVDQLTASEDKLTRMFDLDSRSERAARLWLENRVLSALMKSEESRGIDSAVHRANQIGMPEEKAVFGRVASFLVEGDLAGAAALLPKWDKKAGDDAFYQLAAGAALERAGDIRAVERYQAARDRDDKLSLAHVLLARLVLLELGYDKGKPLVDKVEKVLGADHKSTRALRALAWTVDPDRPKEPPANAKLRVEDRDQLIAPLKPVPYVVEALMAISADQPDKAKGAIETAIGFTTSPSMATQLGFLAINAGDEKLARQAALRAVQFSALYPGARVLASRVALLGGRLDEAKKAIEELDPKSNEVAVVRAVLGYETLDASEMRAAVETFGDAAKQPDYAALAAGPDVLVGRGYPDAEKMETLARPQVPWGELIAVDSALDQGDLELADKLVKEWGDGASRPVFALRVARLRRYQNETKIADTASEIAINRGTTTVPVVIERVYDLLAADKAKDARDVIAKYQAMLGPLTDWLRVLVDAGSGNAAEAKIKAGQLEPPPDGAPGVLRVLAARALGAAKDKRAKNYITAQRRLLSKHKDLELAAAAAK